MDLASPLWKKPDGVQLRQDTQVRSSYWIFCFVLSAGLSHLLCCLLTSLDGHELGYLDVECAEELRSLMVG